LRDTAPTKGDYPQPDRGWQMGDYSYDRLQDPLVRDLAWVAWSPPLLESGELPIKDPLAGSLWRREPERLWRLLLELDANPSACAALLAPSTDFRLGTYFERLWHVLLDLAPDVRVLAKNLRLLEAGVTLGELDLVLEAADGAVVHLELAIKFYMGVPALSPPGATTSPASAWLGPNPQDSLESKLERLRAHQLPLIDRIDLAAAGLPRPDLSCAWLQGQLFAPVHGDLPWPPQCPASNAQNPHLWSTFGEWSKRTEPASGRWQPLPHKRWLMPPACDQGNVEPEWHAEGRRAQMLVEQGNAQRDPLRARRIMLVADDWPGWS
jgi:uncharacterized protein